MVLDTTTVETVVGAGLVAETEEAEETTTGLDPPDHLKTTNLLAKISG